MTWNANELRWQARAALVVAKKNAKVYYLKPPVFTFGIIFPLFFYMAFAAGHKGSPESMAPGIVSMALFFTASAVGPLITP
jgi:ABC-2 type transport system permease protein